VRSGTEVVPSVLPFMEVVPKNVARVGADRSEQPQIGIRGCSYLKLNRLDVKMKDPLRTVRRVMDVQ